MAFDPKALAAEMVEAVRKYVKDALAPVLTRQESTDQILADLEKRVTELEKR